MKIFQSNRAIRKLILVSIVCFVFCGVETVGGLWSNSLAILTDAAHQFSDVAGFVISFIAVACSKRKSNVKYSYGYHRADVLGALATVLIIWALLVWLLYEATNRLIHPEQINVDPTVMLVTSIIGFGCVYLNLVVLFFCCNDPKKKPEDEVDEEKFIVDELVDRLKLGRGALLKKTNVSPGTPRSSHSGRSGTNNVELLPAGNERGSIRDKDQEQKLSPVNTIFTESPKPREEIHQEFRGYVREGEDEEKKEGENVNIRAAIIHMAGDLVQSLGVIAAAIIIYVGDKNGHPEWKIADPICTFLFSVLVLMTTVPIFGDMMRILLEGTPAESVDTIELFDAITKIDFVEELHDFHVWELAPDKPILSAHVVVKNGMSPKLALADLTALVQHEFDIFHSTIQIEEMELFSEDRRPTGKPYSDHPQCNTCHSGSDPKTKLVCFSHDDEQV